MQYLRQNLRFRLRTSPSTISRSTTPTTDNQYFGGHKRVAKTEAKILAQNHFPSRIGQKYISRQRPWRLIEYGGM